MHLHFNCYNGAAGDMLTASLLGLCQSPEIGLEILNSMGLAQFHLDFSLEKVEDKGICGHHLSVTIDGHEEDDHHHHSHHNLGDICHIFDHLTLSDWAKAQGKAIYHRIALAEGQVHGETPDLVHFHEVGALDAVADVAGFCALLEHLSPTKITATPVAVGSGTVTCAHGILPVPAPATALLLENIPTWPGVSTGELCTPTGAAILGHFVESFTEMPSITLEKTAYGFGKRRFPKAANAVTAVLGAPAQEVVELSCNLDDMTGEYLSLAAETLLAEGALDVWMSQILMKKGRPAVTLFCLSHLEQAQHLTEVMFRTTSTLGIRTQTYQRQILPRQMAEIQGVPTKIATAYGQTKAKAEFEFQKSHQ